MNDFLANSILVICRLIVFGILMWGVITMGRGGEYNKSKSNLIMRYRIIECLRKGEPLDQNVYEGCFWSAVTPLSADSVNSGGEPQKFPDFTRGNWKKTQSLEIIS